jgi:hypothetical protein
MWPVLISIQSARQIASSQQTENIQLHQAGTVIRRGKTDDDHREQRPFFLLVRKVAEDEFGLKPVRERELLGVLRQKSIPYSGPETSRWE